MSAVTAVMRPFTGVIMATAVAIKTYGGNAYGRYKSPSSQARYYSNGVLCRSRGGSVAGALNVSGYKWLLLRSLFDQHGIWETWPLQDYMNVSYALMVWIRNAYV
jgi:hypothetical protein